MRIQGNCTMIAHLQDKHVGSEYEHFACNAAVLRLPKIQIRKENEHVENLDFDVAAAFRPFD